jgi:hypothetical protein
MQFVTAGVQLQDLPDIAAAPAAAVDGSQPRVVPPDGLTGCGMVAEPLSLSVDKGGSCTFSEMAAEAVPAQGSDADGSSNKQHLRDDVPTGGEVHMQVGTLGWNSWLLRGFWVLASVLVGILGWGLGWAPGWIIRSLVLGRGFGCLLLPVQLPLAHMAAQQCL